MVDLNPFTLNEHLDEEVDVNVALKFEPFYNVATDATACNKKMPYISLE